MKNYNEFSQEELNNEFKLACGIGNLEIVKLLLTSTELKSHADIHDDNDCAFKWACRNQQWDIAKYLISSQDIKEHINVNTGKDYSFRSACNRGAEDYIYFLIFNMNIEKTKDIKEYLNESSRDNIYLKEVDYLFNKRDLNNTLKEGLSVNKSEDNIKVKI